MMSIIKAIDDGYQCFWGWRKVLLPSKKFIMNTIITPEIREVMEAVRYRPAVSIIMPFEPKISLQTEILYSLKIAADKVEQELQKNYPEEMSKLVMQKLRTIIKTLDFSTHNRSIAVYVSPVFEKVLYLDVMAEEKIIIDESFEIRDLIYNKKQSHKYLVLLLSGKENSMYLGNSDSLVKLDFDVPAEGAAQFNNLPERVANFSDISGRKEIMMDKYLHHIDNALDGIFHTYHLPLFVMGTERIMGHFKKLTRHAVEVVEYIHGNYSEGTEQELLDILRPHIVNWKKAKQKELLSLLGEAAGKKALSFGITDVWREATDHSSRLLVVENNYKYAARQGGTHNIIYKADEVGNQISYIRDAVDDVIEKVLEKGGDVEFVDKDLLSNYQHIALVHYY